MAKRSRRGAGRVKVREDVCEYQDDGIYQREVKTGEREYTISPAEAARRLQEIGDYAGNLAREFQRIEADELTRARTGDDEARRDAAEVEYLLDQARAAISCGTNSYDLTNAYRLGILVGRLQVRPFQPRVRMANAVSRGAKQGAAVTNADHVELHSVYQSDIDRLMNYGKPDGLSYAQAVNEVWRLRGASQSTIKSHTLNKWPRKAGRPRKSGQPPPG